MNAGFDAAIHLQDEAVAENDGSVALFRAEDGGREIRMALTPGFAKSPRMRPDQFSGAAAESSSPGDGAQKRIAECGIPDGAVENALVAAGIAQAHHRYVGKFRLHLFGCIPSRDRTG